MAVVTAACFIIITLFSKLSFMLYGWFESKVECLDDDLIAQM
ncbi:hypothetical protein VIB_002702 [Vibrio metschnikovii CIP 69.14]|nr:hypothetical protein VIB_002702 [Vibrio metschnikovii CIP 69.14]